MDTQTQPAAELSSSVRDSDLTARLTSRQGQRGWNYLQNFLLWQHFLLEIK